MTAPRSIAVPCPELSEAWAFTTQVSALCASTVARWADPAVSCTPSSQPASSPSEEGSRCLPSTQSALMERGLLLPALGSQSGPPPPHSRAWPVACAEGLCTLPSPPPGSSPESKAFSRLKALTWPRTLPPGSPGHRGGLRSVVQLRTFCSQMTGSLELGIVETLHWARGSPALCYGELRGKPSTALPRSHPGSYAGFMHKESSSHLLRRQTVHTDHPG